ncbi:t120 [Tupaiid betaherpesvirus 1]|uniref:T120 n=1 Tax=Tupaiid herpesvirus 1 (strain 1) TaxID=10397 RepID=Q91TI1_TUHV1|nr:t120 [Tupaiid betaherpesvirus 1]AAK57166.1 t120 [Tupaiid betaherpesvirus 1]
MTAMNSTRKVTTSSQPRPPEELLPGRVALRGIRGGGRADREHVGTASPLDRARRSVSARGEPGGWRINRLGPGSRRKIAIAGRDVVAVTPASPASAASTASGSDDAPDPEPKPRAALPTPSGAARPPPRVGPTPRRRRLRARPRLRPRRGARRARHGPLRSAGSPPARRRGRERRGRAAPRAPRARAAAANSERGAPLDTVARGASRRSRATGTVPCTR